MTMDPKSPEAEQARSLLNAEKAHLVDELSTLKREETEDGQISLTGDSASETTAADTRHGLTASLEHQLSEVAAAIARLDDGTYGIDEVSGEPIDSERLKAIPTARTNIVR
jgi:DnaK suppressor protein